MDLFRVVRTSGTTALEGVRTLTEEERSSCEADLALLHSFQRSRAIFPILFRNAGEVETCALQLREVLSAPADQYQKKSRKIGDALNGALVNFLTAMRLYLDHTETRLARTYGKTSAPLAAFNTATSSEFDSTASYRILAKLRNYVQHCGLPIDTAGVNSSLQPGPGGAAVHEVVVGARVSVLLATYDSWGKARADLLSVGDTLRPHEHVPIVMECLERVERTVVKSEVGPLLHAGSRLRNLLIEAQRHDAVPALATVIEVKGGATIQFHEPPYPILETLTLVRLEPDGKPVFQEGGLV